MPAFVLTAQVNFQANNSQLKGITNQLQTTLNNAKLTLNFKLPPNAQRQLQQFNQQIGQTTTNVKQASGELEKFGANAAQSLKKFFGFTLVVTTFYTLAQAVKNATREAIDFQNEVVKIAQVTGFSTRDLKGLTAEVTKLSTSLGVSSKSLLDSSQVLAQAGLDIQSITVALKTLAKVEVAPTFDGAGQAAEAMIAIMSQFKTTAADFERQFSGINAVSAKFAVESSDITTAVRRTGGAFAAAGGNLEQLIALFTSVRATTRESAESIATGFRTIFTRIQRTRTINFLDSLGIQLRDVEGNFVGPLEAVQKLSIALKDLDTRDPRFNQIVEELGGFRQVSKVIPLIQQFGTTQKALIVNQQAANSLNEAAAKSNESLARQIAKVREEFSALVRELADTETFKFLIEGALDLARALIELTRALKPLLPLVTLFAASGLGASAGRIGRGFTGNITQLFGGRFASGGLVPGSGSGDTFPAMLTPGEFVVRKKAVKALGTKRLNELNQFAAGGNPSVDNTPVVLIPGQQFGGAFLFPKNNADNSAFTTALGPKDSAARMTTIAELSRHYIGPDARTNFDTTTQNVLTTAITTLASVLGGGNSGAAGTLNTTQLSQILTNKADIKAIQGNLFEGALAAFAGVTNTDLAGGIKNFDFSRGQIPLLSTLFGPGLPPFLDAKRQESRDSIKDLVNKAISQNNIAKLTTTVGQLTPSQQVIARDSLKKQSAKFATGGPVGTDTIPALLTPGEFVLNKKASSRLGLSFLNQLNQADKVSKFASGGLVGPSSTQITVQPKIEDVLAPGIAIFIKQLQGLGLTVAEIDDRLKKELAGRNTVTTSRSDIRQGLSSNVRTALLNDPLADFGLGGIRGGRPKSLLVDEPSVKIIDELDQLVKQTKRQLRRNHPVVSTTLPSHITGAGNNLGGSAANTGVSAALGGAAATTSGGQIAQAGNTFNSNTLLLATAVLPQLVSQFGNLNSETSKLTNAVANTITQFATLVFIAKQASELSGRGGQSRLAVLQPQIQQDKTKLQDLLNVQNPLNQEIELDRKRLTATKQQVQNTKDTAIFFANRSANRRDIGDVVGADRDTLRSKESAALARTFFASGKIQKENLQVKRDEARENQKIINTNRALLNAREAEEKAILRQQKALNNLTIGIAAVSAIAISAGQLLEDSGRAQITSGNASGRNRLVAGSTLSGAGSGAGTGLAAGLAIGSVVPGLGTALGAAIGTVTGALIGGVSSFIGGANEAERLIHQVKFGEFFKNFNRDLENISSGRSDISLRGGAIRTNISRLEQEFVSSPDAQSRETIKGQIQASTTNINTFLQKLADSSTSLSEFRAKAGDSVRIFADFVGVPIDEVVEGFRVSIEEKAKETKITKQLNAEQSRQFERLREFNNLSGAIQDTIDSFEVFNSTVGDIEAFASGGSGSTQVSNRGGVFGRTSSIIDQGQFQQIVQQTASIFGGRADTLATEAVQAQSIISRLPEILLNVSRQAPLEGEGDFAGRVQEQLKGAPSFVTNAILANISEFIGSEAKDERIINAIQTNVGDVAKRVGGGVLEDIFKFLGESATLLANQTNALASLYDKRRSLEQQLIDGLNETVNLQQQQIEFNAEFRGNRVPLGQLQDLDLRRQENILGANAGLVNNPAAIGNALRESENAILEKTIALQTADFETRTKLLKEIDDEKTNVDRLNGALKFLADVTSRTANLQKELGVLRTRRDAITGVGRDFAAGGIEDRRTLARGGLGAQLLGAGVSPERLPAELRAQAFSFLDRFKGAGELQFLGGRKAEDVEKDAIRKSLVDAGILTKEEAAKFAVPTTQEERLAQQINDAFSRALVAQDILTNNVFQSQLGILKNIENNTAIFAQGLERNLLRGEANTLNEQAAGLQSRISANNAISTNATLASSLISNVGAGNVPAALQGLIANKDILQGVTTELASVRGLESRSGSVNKAISALSATFDNIGGGNRAIDIRLKNPINAAQSAVGSLVGGIPSQFGFSPEDGVSFQELLKLRSAAESNLPGIGSQIFRNVGQNLRFENGVASTSDFNAALKGELDKFAGEIRNRRLALDENLDQLSQSTGLNTQQLSQLGQNPKFRDAIRELSTGLNFQTISAESIELGKQLDILKNKIDAINKKIQGPPVPVPGVPRPAPGVPAGPNGGGGFFSVPSDVSLRNKPSATIGADSLAAINNFTNNITRLTTSMDNFPREIVGTFNHKIEVIHNGAQMFAGLQPSIIELVTKQTTKVMNDMIKTKFPDVGVIV